MEFTHSWNSVLLRLPKLNHLFTSLHVTYRRWQKLSGNGIVQGHLSTLFFHFCYVIYLIFRRAVSSFAGQKSLTPPTVGMLFTPLIPACLWVRITMRLELSNARNHRQKLLDKFLTSKEGFFAHVAWKKQMKKMSQCNS